MEITNEKVAMHISKLRNKLALKRSKEQITREESILWQDKLSLLKSINAQIRRLEQYAQQFQSPSNYVLGLSEVCGSRQDTKKMNEILSICNDLRAIILQETGE